MYIGIHRACKCTWMSAVYWTRVRRIAKPKWPWSVILTHARYLESVATSVNWMIPKLYWWYETVVRNAKLSYITIDITNSTNRLWSSMKERWSQWPSRVSVPRILGLWVTRLLARSTARIVIFHLATHWFPNWMPQKYKKKKFFFKF